MSLYEKLVASMKEAMIAKDKDSLSTIRLLKSAIDMMKINNGTRDEEVTDEDVIEVASKQVKTHKESIEEFTKAARTDLVQKLETEIKLLSQFLPEQLSEEEIRKEIDTIFEEIKPLGKSDMGKIMKEVSLKLKGKADMKLVNGIVQEKLNSL